MTLQEFLARYSFDRTKDKLGAGSFGAVYKAYDTALDGWVALKISPVGSSNTRLSREVELVRGLPIHSNVVRYESCHTFADATGEFDVAVMKYYPEGSLTDLLARKELKPEQTEDLLCQILNGLEFLHSHGVIHRDLKPANILIARRPDGRIVPKITDFGISKQSTGDETMVDETVTAAATVNYASPEQLEGRPIRPSADIWSFGVITYLIVTGHLPFNSGVHSATSLMGRAETVRQITSGSLPEDVESLPLAWKSVIKSCLVADPMSRTVTEPELRKLIMAAGPVAPPAGASAKSAGTSKEPVNDIPGDYQPKPDVDVPNVKPRTNIELKVIIAVLLVALAVLVIYLVSSNWSKSSRNIDNAPVAPEVISQHPVVEEVVETEPVAVGADSAVAVEEEIVDTVATVEVPYDNYIDGHYMCEGIMTDDNGDNNIRLDFNVTGGAITDCVYTNLDLGGKIKMAGQINGSTYGFVGRDGNNAFIIKLHKSSEYDGYFEGVATDGPKTLIVKLYRTN